MSCASRKKYAESDALRDELGDMNVEIIDEGGHYHMDDKR